MVSLAAKEIQWAHYRQHKTEILASGHRFAVVDAVCVDYFEDRNSLYSVHPEFDPNVSPRYGTSPLLIDIGKETNSLAYRKEQIETEAGELENRLIDVLEAMDALALKTEKLEGTAR